MSPERAVLAPRSSVLRPLRRPGAMLSPAVVARGKDQDELGANRPEMNPKASSSQVRLWAKKAIEIVFLGSIIGAFDDLQVRYFPFAELGTGMEIIYQACFLLAAAVAAYHALHRREWTGVRNVSNLLMALPVAALADNVSIDLGTLRPYLVLIPKEGYVWRQQVFGQTFVLSYVAKWVNQQSLAPSLLNGYVASIAVVVAYIALQASWGRARHT
jgi:hypothetical protein